MHTVGCGTWDLDLPSGGDGVSHPHQIWNRYGNGNGKKKGFNSFTAICIGYPGRMFTEPKKADCSGEVSRQIIKTWKSTQMCVTGLYLVP